MGEVWDRPVAEQVTPEADRFCPLEAFVFRVVESSREDRVSRYRPIGERTFRGEEIQDRVEDCGVGGDLAGHACPRKAWMKAARISWRGTSPTQRPYGLNFRTAMRLWAK